MKRRILDIVIMLICTSIFFWCANAYINAKEIKETNTASQALTEEGITSNVNADLTVWYVDSEIEPYLKEVAYQYSAGMEIEFVQVSVLDYLENINKLDQDGEGMPDLYIIDSVMLEKAYLAGLTLTNDSEVYTKENYPQNALSAATYHDELIAYPFYYNTGVLIYNKNYASQAPETFDDILTFANKFDAADYEGVQSILKWDVKDLLYNYGFVGNAIDFGGENGDDSSQINLKNDNAIKCLNYYHALYQYFSIDINSVSYETVVDDFINGKTVFSIVGADAIGKLDESNIDYGIAAFPDLTQELKSKSLSVNKVLVVNPYSNTIEEAKKFAKYLTYEKVDELYALTGYMPSRTLEAYNVEGLKEVMKQYENTVSLPKLMTASDYWLQLQNTLNTVWTGGDSNVALDNLVNKMNSHTNTNTN